MTSRATTSASDVARYILAIQDEEEAITNLKLQKLLYFAQGFHLALRDAPLFSDNIKAWVHGPVVPGVWFEYKGCGADPIPRPANFNVESIGTEERLVIDEVCNVYGQFSAWALREMTHAQGPWKDAVPQAIISHASMAEYFKTLVR